MKFIKGFIIGSFIGFSLGNAVTEQQRKQWTDKVRKQTEPVRRAIGDNVSEVADAATDQVADAVDRTGSVARDKIDGDGQVATHSGAAVGAV